jgi:hypothetical protein
MSSTKKTMMLGGFDAVFCDHKELEMNKKEIKKDGNI